MNGTPYLLAIDGSAESRSAAYFAWELARRSGARVVAQHVVDTQAVWRFLSYDRAGFIGSGLYMDAREQITAAMYSIADALMVSYGSQIEGQSIEFENCLDEGDPATEIARRARNHDMVIVGHNGRDSSPIGYGMFERLTDLCTCPVLVVGAGFKQWSKMQVFINSDISHKSDISGICDLGAALGLPTEICFDPDVEQVDVDKSSRGDWSGVLDVRSIERGNFKELLTSAADDVLLVVPKGIVGGKKNVGYSAYLRAFLSQSGKRGLLLWNHNHTSEDAIKLAS